MRRSFKGKTVEELRIRIKTWCPLGDAHFCDGTPNMSATKLTNHVRPCEYFIDGICTEPHIYACGREENK